MNKKIPVFDIALGEEKEYIKDCVDTSFIGQGPYVKKLEEKFSAFVDCKFSTYHKWNNSFTFSLRSCRN